MFLSEIKKYYDRIVVLWRLFLSEEKLTNSLNRANCRQYGSNYFLQNMLKSNLLCVLGMADAIVQGIVLHLALTR